MRSGRRSAAARPVGPARRRPAPADRWSAPAHRQLRPPTAAGRPHILNRGLRPTDEDRESMSPKRPRVAALTLLCALAVASGADASGAIAVRHGARSEAPSAAMTLDEAADLLQTAAVELPPGVPETPL